MHAGDDATRAPGPDPAAAELGRRLAADLAALLAAVAGLSQEQAEWRPTPDRWSVGEVLDHVAISNRYFARAVEALLARARDEGRAAVAGGRRVWPRLRVIAEVAATGPVRHPPRTAPTPGRALAALVAELEASHRAVTDNLARLGGVELDAVRHRHPLGFDLNLFQWVDAAGAHERRHLTQIEAVKAAPGFPGLRGA